LHQDDLLNKIKSKEAVLGVVGLGYVGLPLSIRFAECGFAVSGFDIDQKKVSRVNSGDSYMSSVNSESLIRVKDKILATTDFSLVGKADVIIMCLPTPLTAQREPDLSHITTTLEVLAPFLRQGQALVLESTTWPGTTEQIIAKFVEKLGFRIGNDFFIIYSPEREDPGNESYSTQQIPKVVSGVTKECLQIAEALYGTVVIQTVPVSSTKAAEMTKLLENIYRAVNIGLANEMKIISHAMGLDIHEIIAAAATKPFGFVPYYPGPGLGGHCIPIDPFYLSWKAREFGLNTKFIELAGEVNGNMPAWVVGKITNSLNEHNKAVKSSSILVLGLSYKKNVNDARESPSVEIIKLLDNLGAEVAYSDPFIPSFPKMAQYDFDLENQSLTADLLMKFDCVVLATDHDQFDYDLIISHSKILIDTRGKFPRGERGVVSA
jgi:UDP-N-acetyl-D-glucosamine dehydrogenase